MVGTMDALTVEVARQEVLGEWQWRCDQTGGRWMNSGISTEATVQDIRAYVEHEFGCGYKVVWAKVREFERGECDA